MPAPRADLWGRPAGSSVQELLDHPFLRPTQAPVAGGSGGGAGSGEVRLSKEQLTKLLKQVGREGGGRAARLW